MSALPRLRPGLLRHNLDKQFLVYDPRLDRIHLLDQTTAFVFDLMEGGGYSSDMMTREVAKRSNVAPDPAFVSLALEELRAAGLLDESTALVPELGNATRRDLVRKLALGGAAALLIPAVATLTATRGYAQSSINQPPDAPCLSDANCASGICCEGRCAVFACNSVGACGRCFTDGECIVGECGGTTAAPRACGGTGLGNDKDKLPNGQACNGNGECCSNNCANPPGPGGGVCA